MGPRSVSSSILSPSSRSPGVKLSHHPSAFGICSVLFRTCDGLQVSTGGTSLDPSFVTFPSILHGGLLWYWALNHGGPCSGEPSRAWWIFFRWYRVFQSSMPRVASLGRFVS